MWHDHLFSQRNMTAEKTVRWQLEVTGKWGWAGRGGVSGQTLKRGVQVRQYRGEGLHKIIGLAPSPLKLL